MLIGCGQTTPTGPFEAWMRKSDGYLLRYFATSRPGNATFTYSMELFNTGGDNPAAYAEGGDSRPSAALGRTLLDVEGTSANLHWHHVELAESRLGPLLARLPTDRVGEHRRLKREGVVYAVPTSGIDPSGGDLLDEALVDGAPELGRIEPFQIHAGDDSAASALHELAHQVGRRLSPDGLDVLEPGAGHPFLVSGADVSEMNVAEHDAREPFRAEFGELYAG